MIIDIVGIKKCGKVYENLDKYFVLCVMIVFECSDIVFFVFDVIVGI